MDAGTSTVAAPELKLRLGTRLKCSKGHPWLFVGYLHNTVSTELVFLRIGVMGSPHDNFYRAVKAPTLELKFPGITELSKIQPAIRKVMDLSTAHITEATSRLLDVWADLVAPPGSAIVYSKGEYGFLVYVPSEMPPREERHLIPDDLWSLMQLAQAQGCDWLHLDRDGTVFDHLPSWDW